VKEGNGGWGNNQPVEFSGKPREHVPTTRQTPSGFWPHRIWRTMGLAFPMQSIRRRDVSCRVLPSSPPGIWRAQPLGCTWTQFSIVLSDLLTLFLTPFALDKIVTC